MLFPEHHEFYVGESTDSARETSITDHGLTLTSSRRTSLEYINDRKVLVKYDRYTTFTGNCRIEQIDVVKQSDLELVWTSLEFFLVLVRTVDIFI